MIIIYCLLGEIAIRGIEMPTHNCMFRGNGHWGMVFGGNGIPIPCYTYRLQRNITVSADIISSLISYTVKH